MNPDNLPADPAETTLVPAAATTPAPDGPAAGLTADEGAALEMMKKPLREAALEMRRRAREGELALMRERYAMGQQYLTIKGQPQVYGPMSDVQLAEFFGADAAVLKEARRLARRYSPEQFEAILAARNPRTGLQVTYQHLVILQRVEDDALAAEALATALADSWTPAQLTRAINRKLNAAAGRLKEPPRPKPDRLPGYLMNVHATTGEWNRQYDEVWERGSAVIDAFDALPPEKIDAALVQRLAECRDQAESAAEAQRSLGRHFESLRARVAEAVSRRQRGAGA